MSTLKLHMAAHALAVAGLFPFTANAELVPAFNPYGSIITLDTEESFDPTYLNQGTIVSNVGLANFGSLYNDYSGSLESYGSFTNWLNAFVYNYGSLENFGHFGNYYFASLENYGSVHNAGHLSNTGSIYNDYSGSFENNGSVWNTDGASLENLGSLYNNGTLLNLSSTLRNRGSLYNSGSLDNGSGFLFNYGSLYNSSSLNAGELNNYGSVHNSGFLYNGLVTNMGVIHNDFSGYLQTNIVSNSSSGELYNDGHLDNSGELHNYGHLDNSGELHNSSHLYNIGGVLTGTGTYIQTGGTTLNNGTMTQSLFDFQGGEIRGNSIFNGTVNIAAAVVVTPGFAPGTHFWAEGGSIVMPDNSPGTIVINGDLYSSGDYVFQISGTASGQYSVLQVNGNATFSGGHITFGFDGYSPNLGESFGFLVANSFNGRDTLSWSVVGLGAGFEYEVVYSGNTSHLSITAVPEAETYAMLLAGLGLVGTMVRRRKQAEV